MLRYLMPRKKKQPGSALLSALFIMTMVAIAATAMTTRLQVDIYRTRLMVNSNRFYLAAQMVMFWGMEELRNPKNLFLQSDGNGRVARFPERMQTYYPQLRVEGDLVDLQSRLNLNNINHRDAIAQMMQLLRITAKLPPAEQAELAHNLMRWQQPWDPARGQDKLLKFYMSQKPPYLPGFQALQSPSELRLVKGYNQKIYRSLEPYIIALPAKTKINVNTASIPVLRSLGYNLSEEKIQPLIAARSEKGIEKLSKISPILNKIHLSPKMLSTESEYFMAIARVSDTELRMVTYFLLHRVKRRNKPIAVYLISENINSL